MNTTEFLTGLNKTYYELHSRYEDLFWKLYMGDKTLEDAMNKALSERDAFRSDTNLTEQVEAHLKEASGEEKSRLLSWKLFFSKFQTPKHLQSLREHINSIESKIQNKRDNRKEGYIDPSTGEFVQASEGTMKMMMATHADVKIRKACFDAAQQFPEALAQDYIELVQLRNQFAQEIGFTDFYDYKSNLEEGMSSKEVFAIFDEIYENTKYAFKDIRELEKTIPDLRKPWNFGFLMAGDFIQEEDPYLRFETSLDRWMKSFTGLGISFRGGTLTLDLLDRPGKYNNGFCHAPRPVYYDENNARHPGTIQFTCTANPKQVGSGSQGLMTLFHEGGHAAHFANFDEREVCLNTEYPPASTAWAETQSMFLDEIAHSIEWKTRYAENESGELYPFDLYERRVRKMHVLRPLNMMSISSVIHFERTIYEYASQHTLTKEKVFEIAYETFDRYFDRSERSLSLLNIPHIYSWESACSYHAYGLATLALTQWREYFYETYGHIVDNPNIGLEMTRVWKQASSKTFKEFVREAMKRELSPIPYVKNVTMSVDEILEKAQDKIAKLADIQKINHVDLDATIRIVDGDTVITESTEGFEVMDGKFRSWIQSR